MIGNSNERLTRTLAHLKAGLEPYVESVLQERHPKNWRRVVRNTFSPEHPIAISAHNPGPINWDVAGLLFVIDNLWNADFASRFDRSTRSWIKELRDVRNRWAHQDPMDAEQTWRAIDSAERLLRAVNANDLAEAASQEKRGLLSEPNDVESIPQTPSSEREIRSLRPARVRRTGTSDGKVLALHLGVTYYNQGFFNVPVAYDNLVTRDGSTVEIVTEPDGLRIEARVDRKSNPNGTARVMGGKQLRNWIQNTCSLGEVIFIDLSTRDRIRISRKRFTGTE